MQSPRGRFGTGFWLLVVGVVGLGVGMIVSWQLLQGSIGTVVGLDSTHRAVGIPASTPAPSPAPTANPSYNQDIESAANMTALKAAVAIANPDNPTITSIIYADLTGDKIEDALVGYTRVGTAQTMIAVVYSVDTTGKLKLLWTIPDTETLGHSQVAIGPNQMILYGGATAGSSTNDTVHAYKWTGTTFSKQ